MLVINPSRDTIVKITDDLLRVSAAEDLLIHPGQNNTIEVGVDLNSGDNLIFMHIDTDDTINRNVIVRPIIKDHNLHICLRNVGVSDALYLSGSIISNLVLVPYIVPTVDEIEDVIYKGETFSDWFGNILANRKIYLYGQVGRRMCLEIIRCKKEADLAYSLMSEKVEYMIDNLPEEVLRRCYDLYENT